MLRQRALNPDRKKGEDGAGDMAKKSNLMSKFAEIESADEESEQSDGSYDTDWTYCNQYC